MFVGKSRSSLRTWQFHYVVINQIVSCEFHADCWEVAKIVASEVRVIRCSWFGNITTNKFKQSEKKNQPGKAYFMMFTSGIKLFERCKWTPNHLVYSRNVNTKVRQRNIEMFCSFALSLEWSMS